MNGITLTIRALHDGEKHLAEQLMTVAERHRTDHEVHHVAADLAEWSREHVQRLTDIGHAYSLEFNSTRTASGPQVLSTLREKAAEAVGRRPDSGLLLLQDLRNLHLGATENSLHWEMLTQAAQATKDNAVLAVASACHPRTLRQMRWTNTMIKVLSPQILTSP